MGEEELVGKGDMGMGMRLGGGGRGWGLLAPDQPVYPLP